MKFTTRKDTNIAADKLFDAVNDFDRLERIIKRRKAQVTRIPPESGEIHAWNVAFDWRGRRRELRFAVTDQAPHETLSLHGNIESFDLEMQITFVALTRSRSRVISEVNARPRSMKARLILQSAKLTKGKLDKRYAQNIATFVDQLIEGY